MTSIRNPDNLYCTEIYPILSVILFVETTRVWILVSGRDRKIVYDIKKAKCHFYCRPSLCFYGRVVGRELVTKKPGQNYVMAFPNQGLKVFGNSSLVSVSEVQRSW